MKTPVFHLPDWLRQTGNLPLGFEYYHTKSVLKFLRWVVNDDHPALGVKLANAPGFETWVFPHIPRAAGTAIVEALNASDGLASVMVEILGSLEPDERRHILLNAMRTRKVVLSGHIHLKHWGNFIRWNGTEKIFTILRDPVEIHVSNINFIMGRIGLALRSPELDKAVLGERVAIWQKRYSDGLFDAPTQGDLDAVASWLAMTDRTFTMTPHFARSLIASKAYTTIYREIIAQFLGLGDESAEQTVDLMRRLGVFIVLIEHTAQFMKRHFDCDIPRGVNARLVNVLDANGIDQEVLQNLVGRDGDLYIRLQELAWQP